MIDDLVYEIINNHKCYKNNDEVVNSLVESYKKTKSVLDNDDITLVLNSRIRGDLANQWEKTFELLVKHPQFNSSMSLDSIRNKINYWRDSNIDKEIVTTLKELEQILYPFL